MRNNPRTKIEIYRIDVALSDNEANLRKLVFKRARFYYNIDYLMTAQLRAPMFNQKVRVLPNSLEEQPMYLVVSRKVAPAVDAQIVAAFKVLRNNGELSAIFNKHGLTAHH